MYKKLLALLLCILMVWSIVPPIKTHAAAGIEYAPYMGVDFMNAPISLQRKAALIKAMQMVTIKWTCPADFPTWRSIDNSIGTAVATDGTAAKKFIKGKTYTGIPYSMSDHAVDDIAWHKALTSGEITTSYMTGSYHGNGTTTAHGMDCSYFVYLALKAANAGSVTYRNTTALLSNSAYSRISWSNLKPADMFLKKGHVMMFVGKSGDQYAVFECEGVKSKCTYNVYTKKWLTDNGYMCYRYNNFNAYDENVPTNAEITVDKTELAVNEKITLKLSSDVSCKYDLSILDKNIGKTIVSKTVTDSCTHVFDKAGVYSVHMKAYNSSGSIESNTVTLYVGKYTVRYSGNGGNNIPAEQTKIYGKDVLLSETVPTREGYNFVGWSVDDTSGEVAYQPGESYTDNENVTLYAVWKKHCENDAHSYTFKVAKNPTVSGTGSLTGSCSQCAAVRIITLPAFNDTDYTHEIIDEVTCTENGSERYSWNNTEYGEYVFDAVVTSKGHTVVTDYKPGYTDGKYCSVCGKIFVEQLEVSTEKLAAPVIKLANTSTGIKISWGKIAGAPEYDVYRSANGKSWSKINTTTGLSYTDTQAKSGTSYYYTVKAFRIVNGKKSVSDCDKTKSIIRLIQPTIKFENMVDGVKISWNVIGGTTGYMVFRSDDGKTWTRLKTTTVLNYTDTDAKAGQTYYYTVKAYKTVNGKKIYSSCDKTRRMIRLAQPVVKLSANSSSIKIGWDKIAGAAGYDVYRSADGKIWSKIKTTTSTSCTDKTPVEGMYYYYTVKGYQKVDDKKIISSCDKTQKAIRLQQPVFTMSNTSGGIKISWEKVNGAEGCSVLRSMDGENWFKIAVTTNLSYTDTKASAGETYYYTVEAYKTINEKKFYSNCSPTQKIIRLQQPIVTLANTSKGVKVSWKKISGAAGYDVYRSDNGKSWSKVKTTTGLSYTDTTVIKGKTYYYTVKAYQKVEGKKIISSCDKTKRIQCDR